MEIKNKAVFLDRDGTVIKDFGYNCDVNKIEILPNVTQALKKLQTLGYLLIIVTNQSGVARGFFTEEQLKLFNSAVEAKFESSGVKIAATYYCPHYENGVVKKYAVKCGCRKPETQLFMRAAKDFNLNLSNCWAIGNDLRDCAISEATACKSCLICGAAGAEGVSHNKNIFAVSGWEEITALISGEN